MRGSRSGLEFQQQIDPHPGPVIAAHAPDRVVEASLEHLGDALGADLLERAEVEPADEVAAQVTAQDVGDHAREGAEQLVDGVVLHVRRAAAGPARPIVPSPLARCRRAAPARGPVGVMPWPFRTRSRAHPPPNHLPIRQCGTTACRTVCRTMRTDSST